jgi:hypothetical protein
VELDPVKEGAVTDGTGVGSSSAEGSEVGFAGASQVSLVDGEEGDRLDGVDPDRPPPTR